MSRYGINYVWISGPWMKSKGIMKYVSNKNYHSQSYIFSTVFSFIVIWWKQWLFWFMKMIPLSDVVMISEERWCTRTGHWVIPGPLKLKNISACLSMSQSQASWIIPVVKAHIHTKQDQARFIFFISCNGRMISHRSSLFYNLSIMFWYSNTVVPLLRP